MIVVKQPIIWTEIMSTTLEETTTDMEKQNLEICYLILLKKISQTCPAAAVIFTSHPSLKKKPSNSSTKVHIKNNLIKILRTRAIKVSHYGEKST